MQRQWVNFVTNPCLLHQGSGHTLQLHLGSKAQMECQSIAAELQLIQIVDVYQLLTFGLMLPLCASVCETILENPFNSHLEAEAACMHGWWMLSVVLLHKSLPWT